MRLGEDLKDPRAIALKGWLFLMIAVLSAVGLLMQTPTIQNCLLVTLLAWSSARWYYFAFYVIERYVDPSFRFAGIGSFLRYVIRNRRD